jgi:hypothetical protein
MNSTEELLALMEARLATMTAQKNAKSKMDLTGPSGSKKPEPRTQKPEKKQI